MVMLFQQVRERRALNPHPHRARRASTDGVSHLSIFVAARKCLTTDLKPELAGLSFGHFLINTKFSELRET
jgi:hypothetical protein